MILDIQSEEVKQKLGYYKKLDELTVMLRSARRAKGLTLRSYAKEIDCTMGFASQIERGEITPSDKVIMKIAEVLDMDYIDILVRFEKRTVIHLTKERDYETKD